MKSIFTVKPLLVFCFLLSAGHLLSQTKKPNVIILYADDMRAKTIHALGNDEVITPNLDQLVKNGTSFTHAYNQGGHTGAVCVSSRAMLFTGQNIHHLGNDITEIPEHYTFLGNLFSSMGYQTYGVGKWHNGVEAYVSNFKGGDEIMFGGMTTSQWQIPLNHFSKNGVYDHPYEPSDPKNRDLSRIADHVYEGRHSAEIFADAAVNFLNTEKSAGPFFLYVAFTTPHDPRQMPPEYMRMYDKVNISLPPNFMPEHPFDNGHMKGRDEKLLGFPRKPEEVKKEIKDYYATITHLDAQIGRIMEALKKSGQYENTIIVFAGDNGLALGQHGLMGKQNLYEHTIGVPMLWSGPGIAKNLQSNAFCYLTDIYPTLCDVLNTEKPSSVDGQSFFPALKGEKFTGDKPMFFSFRDLQRAVSDGRYKLIEYNVKGVRTTQLFDLSNDPWEMKNLANDPAQKTRIASLRKQLSDYSKKEHDDSPFWDGF